MRPLAEGMRLGPPPCAMVVFGGTGDLVRRMLVPALYELLGRRLLPVGFCLVGAASQPYSDDSYRDLLREALERRAPSRPVEASIWQTLAARTFYVPLELGDSAGYRRLSERLTQLEAELGTMGNRLFYLATPPSYFATVARELGAADLARSPGFCRIVVEKPFGRDLASARRLNAELHTVFDESQIFRIDHYLAKETVQNLLFFRFVNGVFEPVWNRNTIDHVQITVAETVGVEGRGRYYEEAGALRDMFQSHLLQLLSLTAMEPPVDFGAEAIRDEKVKALRTVRPISTEDASRYAVRCQYTAGRLDGREVPAYRQESLVSPTSSTETFAAVRLELQGWRWAGVPFYLRSGKRLPRRVSEIAVVFKKAPLPVGTTSITGDGGQNLLVFRIQPDEGIALRFAAKRPGLLPQLGWVTMDFRYSTSFGVDLPSAYERLLLDCMLGDGTLFAREDEVIEAWRLVTPILEAWQAQGSAPPACPAGSWGPLAADELLEAEGRAWRQL